MYCPHTTEPVPHSLEDRQHLTDPQECPICHLFIRHCSRCGQANRLAARFCTSCGSPLEALSYPVIRLLLPGEIRETITHVRRYGLTEYLQLDQEHYPLMWLGVGDGVYVLSRSRAASQLPVWLHYVPHYQFDKPVKVTDQLAPLTNWVQKPLLSEQGLFLAARDRLHFFPAHGYADHSHPPALVWQPAKGERILAIGLEETGHPLLLAGSTSQELVVLRGNAQAGSWGDRRQDWRIPLEIKVREGTGYSIGTVNLPPLCCWIYDGVTLTLLNLDTHQVQPIVLAEMFSEAARPAPLLTTRRGYFEPFFIKPFGTAQPSFVLPLKPSAEHRLEAGMLRLGATNRTDRLPAANWILPDPWKQGLVMGSDSALWRMQGFGAGEADKVTGDFSVVQPLLLPSCFIALTNNSTAPGGGVVQAVQLLVFQNSLLAGQYHSKLLVREPLPDSSGTPLGGLPPLYAGGNVWVALRRGNKENAPVTVYAIQIAQK